MAAQRSGHGLQELQPGRWKVTVNIPSSSNPDGKRHRKVAYVNGGKRDAERKRRQMLAQRDDGQLKPRITDTLREFLEAWMKGKTRGSNKVASRTAERWQTLINKQVTPHIGDLPLRDVTPATLRNLYDDLHEEGYSGTTVHKVYSLLRMAFMQGIEDGTVRLNPCRRKDAPKKDTPEAKSLSETQAAALLEGLSGTSIFVPVLLALDCGLRRGELLGLKWSDVDLTAGWLTIRRAVEESGAGVALKETKTGKSRSILMTKRAAAALRQHKKTQASYRLALSGRWVDEDLVFPATKPHRGKVAGRIWRPSSFSRTYRESTHAVGYDIGVHTLRHTMATIMLRAGRPTREVADRLGHSSTKLTSDTYQHVLRDQQEDGVAAFDKMFARIR